MDLINIIKKNKKTLFTTPGHSHGNLIPPRVKQLLGKKIFEADFSENEGFDNIRHPQGVLLEAQEQAAKIYDTKHSFYLFNGSTSGILALMTATVGQGDKVIIARNAHISVVNALVFSGAKPVWINSQWDEKWNISKAVKPQEIEKAVNENPDAKAVWITSPTYEGITSDIEKISNICKAKGLLFIVDEAHGALFPFSDRLPKSAIPLGADACVQSLHKTALTLTQSAILHIAKDSVICADKVRQALNLINSTSPSYLILASIDGCVKYLNTKKGKQKLEIYLDNICKFRQKVSQHQKISLYENDDFTKLLINIEGISGYDLSQILYDRFDIENEYENEYAILCLTGMGTSEKKLDKLANALIKIANLNACHSEEQSDVGILSPELTHQQKAEMVFTPHEAYYKPSQKIPVSDCLGKISKETIVPYPPGVPVLIAGERIAQAHLQYLKDREWVECLI